MDKELVYFADPMCSWCYGFAPVVAAIEQHFRGRLPLRLVVGGLHAGLTQPMRDQEKERVRGAWTRVNAATGQPFDFSFFDREEFVNNTEPACRAVVAVRTLDPSRALAFMEHIQTAFYAQNRDVTSTEVLADLAAEEGHDRSAFVAAFLSPDVRNETFRDFVTAQEFGIDGFPTLIVGGGREYAIITNGYRPLDGIPEALDQWLASQPEA